jgi:hypothetical protein
MFPHSIRHAVKKGLMCPSIVRKHCSKALAHFIAVQILERATSGIARESPVRANDMRHRKWERATFQASSYTMPHLIMSFS